VIEKQEYLINESKYLESYYLFNGRSNGKGGALIAWSKV
jgi:hypothetical protein